MQPTPPGPPRDVVLVGGGHAHVQVLRRQLMEPLPGARLTVVVDRPVAVYSGMVPGFVAGQYPAHALEIDVRPLARRAGARVVVAAAERIDPARRQVHLVGRPPLPYDLCSLNIGSTVAGADLPGVREHALSTRPIGRFVSRLDAALAELAKTSRGRSPRVVVVGAGAGGVELAFCLHARLKSQGRSPGIHLLGAGPHPLPGKHRRIVARVRAAAQERGITLSDGVRVASVEPDGVRLEDGTLLPADLVVWVAGAAPHGIARRSGLPVEGRGFVRIGDDLRVVGRPELFAVGDCAVLDSWPACPRAGVYAVRQGPVLADNLAAALRGARLGTYVPQRDFLTLLNLGDGRAIGARNGIALDSRIAFAVKDRIDRRFMARFQVLQADGSPQADFEVGMPEMGEMAMGCGGCAAKVGATPLSRALSRLPPQDDPDIVMGLDPPDDAVALRRAHETIVASVDAFPAFTDDPWLVGRVAARNAISDLQAKGVDPRLALAHVSVPESEDPEECLYQVLAGVRNELDALGCTLGGGHTTVGPRLHVGLSVVGFAEGPEALVPKGGAQAGDVLVLSDALGTGVLFHADMAGRAAGPWVEAAIAGMLRDNGAAARIAIRHGARGMTDVTGFGLAGHLGELLSAADVGARIDLEALPALPGVFGLLARGERSTFHHQNVAAMRSFEHTSGPAGDPAVDLLADPQTAGPLLVAVPPESADTLVAALKAEGFPSATRIGSISAWKRGTPRVRLSREALPPSA
jgi:selenide, water dikinase